MDFKELIKWSVKRWWWFVISVVACLIAGGLYYFFKAPVFNVEAVLMLRQSDDDSGNQNEMLQMMGFGGNKITGDEVRVLTSRDLIGRVVDSLDLATTYFKHGRYATVQYPKHDLTVSMVQEQIFTVKVKIKVRDNDYKVVIKSNHKKESFTVSSLDEPLHTFVGDVFITMSDSIEPGTYSAVIEPKFGAVDGLLKQLHVNRLARESNVITLSIASTCPARAIDAINTLLDLYNEEATYDKNLLALQTEQFLTDRLAIVSGELDAIETELESYKRQQQIANLDNTANSYRQTGDAYDDQIAELDAEFRMMELLSTQLSDTTKMYTIVPGNVGVSDASLNGLIVEYNGLIAHRNLLLQTATEQNPIVELVSEQIDQKRTSILSGIVQSRQTLVLRRQFIATRQQQYDSRLASIPQTERRYLELQRDKQTMEKQYLFLIEKREENAMLLASKAVPAKIVDRAQRDPVPSAPKMKVVAAGSILLGLLLPLFFFVIGVIRKEYL